MYPLILLLLCLIAQIAASEALAHGRYARFNRVNDPNVSVSATISYFTVSHLEVMTRRFNGWQIAFAILAMGPSIDPFRILLRVVKGL